MFTPFLVPACHTMRHLSPFALLGELALASAQSSADSTVGGTRRLLNEKTALPLPKRVLLC